MGVSNRFIKHCSDKTVISAELNLFYEKTEQFILNNIIEMYDGKRSFFEREIIILSFRKQLEKIKISNYNLYIGLVAEFLLLIILKQEKFNQEYSYKNLEEDAAKKGFDGLFTKDENIWIMESKSSSSSTSHDQNVKIAYDQIKETVERTDKNNPWLNAVNHSKNYGSEESLIKKLAELSKNYTNGVNSVIENENIILGSVIYNSDLSLANKSISYLANLIISYKFKECYLIGMNVSDADVLIKFLNKVDQK